MLYKHIYGDIGLYQCEPNNRSNSDFRKKIKGFLEGVHQFIHH